MIGSSAVGGAGREMGAWSAAVGALLLAGCGGDGTAAAGGDAGTIWPLEIDHEIGSLEDEAQSLTRVGDVAIGSDGELFVAQPSDRNIRVHAEDGGLLRIIGREGEGPGELSGSTRMGLAGDSLWVLDAAAQRLTWFSPGGEVLSTLRWVAEPIRKGPVMHILSLPADLRVREDGTLLAIPITLSAAVRRTAVGGPPPVDPVLFNPPVLLLTSSGELRDTVVVADVSVKDEVADGLLLLFTSPPFHRLDAAGEGVVFAERVTTGNPDPGTFRVGRILVTGDTLFDRAYPYDPIPTPADAMETSMEGLSPERRQSRREMLRTTETLPALTDMVITGDLIWLAREAAAQDSVAWWALDPESGDHRGTVHLPPGQEIVAGQGEVLIAKRTDEFDVPYLVRYRVGR